MKKLLSFLSLIILASCGESGNAEKSEPVNILENLQIMVDTLTIEASGEIFMPDMLFAQAQSADGNRIFSFYEPDFEFFEISLEKRQLLKRHPFQREGPNGIKGWMVSFQMLDADEAFLRDELGPNLFGLDGIKTKAYELDFESILGFKAEGPFSQQDDLHISPDKSRFVFLPMNFGEPVKGLASIEIKNQTGKILEIPALDLTSKFQVIWQEGNSSAFFGDAIQLQLINDQFIVFSGSTSDVYSYDYQLDSLRLITFDHQLVENSKSGEFETVADTRERQMETVAQIRKQITFNKFYWDPSRKMYFRFGTKNFIMPSPGVQRSSDCYLFAYDENLNLVGEKFLEEFKNIPYSGYFYNGQFYSYTPVADEAGFAVFTLKF
jgi:hypothetical protein